MNVVEASIADLHNALETGAASCVDLVRAYLDRIAKFDRDGPFINSVFVNARGVLNGPAAQFEEYDHEGR